jgi:prepilin-type N-terminal cleavage/methylation domain-containing protein
MRGAGRLTPNEGCATRVHPSHRGGAVAATARLSARRPRSRSACLPRDLLCTADCAAGYTLLELLLVLAILVAVASAVTPTVVTRMSEYRLKQGAEAARFALAATRIHAIDLSSVYQFRYEPGGRRYVALPTDSDAVTAAKTSKQSAPNGGLPRSYVEYGILPENITFEAAAPPASTGSIGARSDAQTPAWSDKAWATALAQAPNASDFNSAAWSPPIVFRADGTAIDAAVNVVDGHGEGFQVKVRELTGEVSLGPLVTGTP